jgi:hypothetical protein
MIEATDGIPPVQQEETEAGRARFALLVGVTLRP